MTDPVLIVGAGPTQIADNRLAEIATWGDRLLAEQLKDLSLLGLDFNLELTGFEMGEIDLRIASLEDPVDRKDDPADLLPHLPNSSPVSQIGDVWCLGRHSVICANALDPAAFASSSNPASSSGESRANPVIFRSVREVLQKPLRRMVMVCG